MTDYRLSSAYWDRHRNLRQVVVVPTHDYDCEDGEDPYAYPSSRPHPTSPPHAPTRNTALIVLVTGTVSVTTLLVGMSSVLP